MRFSKKFLTLSIAFLISTVAISFAQSVSLSSTDEGQFIVTCSFPNFTGKCILDSGARISFVSATEKSNGYTKGDSFWVHGVNGSLELETVQVKLLSVGNVLKHDRLRMARSNNFQGLPAFDGVIGADVLAGQNLRYVFPGLREKPSISVLSSEMKSQFKTFGKLYPPNSLKSRIEIEVLIADKQVHAMWDTHATTLFSSRFIRDNPTLFTVTGSKESTDALGKVGTSLTYKLNEKICMADVCADPLWPVEAIDDKVLGNFSNGQIDMIVGLDFMYNAIWAFDYSSNQFSVILKR